MDRSVAKPRRRFSETPNTDAGSTSTVTEEFLATTSLGGDSPDSSLARAAAPAYADADLGVAADAFAAPTSSEYLASPSVIQSNAKDRAQAHLDLTGESESRAATPKDADSGLDAGDLSTPTLSDAPSPSATSISDGKVPGTATLTGVVRCSVSYATGDAAAATTGGKATLAAAVAMEPSTAVPTDAGASSSSTLQIGRRRNRWDQASRCLHCHSSAAERVMTCCGAFLCTACAMSNLCRCLLFQEGFGAAVPILPRYVVPADHVLAHRVNLPRARWQLFDTHRAPGGEIVYSFYNVEQAFYSRHAGVLCQTHVYEGIVGHVWSRFSCRLALVQEGGIFDVLLEFAIPPSSQQDVVLLFRLLDLYWQHH